MPGVPMYLTMDYSEARLLNTGEGKIYVLYERWQNSSCDIENSEDFCPWMSVNQIDTKFLT